MDYETQKLEGDIMSENPIKSMRLLFNVGPFSNLEVELKEGSTTVTAKTLYDALVTRFGEPKDPPKKSFGGGNFPKKPAKPKMTPEQIQTSKDNNDFSEWSHGNEKFKTFCEVCGQQVPTDEKRIVVKLDDVYHNFHTDCFRKSGDSQPQPEVSAAFPAPANEAHPSRSPERNVAEEPETILGLEEEPPFPY